MIRVIDVNTGIKGLRAKMTKIVILFSIVPL